MQDGVGVWSGVGWELGIGTGKAVWGQWEGWILFIDHILSHAFIYYFNIYL